jgi:beta-glucosidase
VIGPNAGELQVSGGGSSTVTPPYQVSPLVALRLKLEGGVEVGYEQGCGYEAGQDEVAIRRAVELARGAEVALVFAGMPKGYESEGSDRPTWPFLARRPSSSGGCRRTPRGDRQRRSPVCMRGSMKSQRCCPYYPGLEGGTLLPGFCLARWNPSGKLPVTFRNDRKIRPLSFNYPERWKSATGGSS